MSSPQRRTSFTYTESTAGGFCRALSQIKVRGRKIKVLRKGHAFGCALFFSREGLGQEDAGLGLGAGVPDRQKYRGGVGVVVIAF